MTKIHTKPFGTPVALGPPPPPTTKCLGPIDSIINTGKSIFIKSLFMEAAILTLGLQQMIKDIPTKRFAYKIFFKAIFQLLNFSNDLLLSNLNSFPHLIQLYSNFSVGTGKITPHL